MYNLKELSLLELQEFNFWFLLLSFLSGHVSIGRAVRILAASLISQFLVVCLFIYFSSRGLSVLRLLSLLLSII